MKNALPKRPRAAGCERGAICLIFLLFTTTVLVLAGCATAGVALSNPAEIASASLDVKDHGEPRCFICDAKIRTEERLHIEFVYEGGTVRLVEDAREAAGALKALEGFGQQKPRVMVFDHASGEKVDAGSAFAVVGSTFTPARKLTSGGAVLFFRSSAGADEAVKGWGGKVVSFAEAIRAISPAQDDPPPPARRSSGSDRGSGRSSGGSSGGGAGGGHHH